MKVDESNSVGNCVYWCPISYHCLACLAICCSLFILVLLVSNDIAASCIEGLMFHVAMTHRYLLYVWHMHICHMHAHLQYW